MEMFLARLSVSRFSQSEISERAPTRCPFHPDLPDRHWHKAGYYERKDPSSPRHDPRTIWVPRCRCKLAKRTFSLLHDAILPYQHQTTATILRWLHCMVVEGHGAAKASQILLTPRSTLRRIRAKFHATVKVLRLPEHSGVFDGLAFLSRLFALGIDAITELFAEWKEREPKLSLVGIYPR